MRPPIKKLTTQPPSTKSLIDSLMHHRVNTLTELCRIERAAASCPQPSDLLALRQPMTAAWHHYVVTSSQFLTELRGLSPAYPFSGDVVQESLRRVREDPGSDRSWNLAWLCLMKVLEDGLIPAYAVIEAACPDMWGQAVPSTEDMARLASCFEFEWTAAVHTMLRHWASIPAWR